MWDNEMSFTDQGQMLAFSFFHCGHRWGQDLPLQRWPADPLTRKMDTSPLAIPTWYTVSPFVPHNQYFISLLPCMNPFLVLNLSRCNRKAMEAAAAASAASAASAVSAVSAAWAAAAASAASPSSAATAASAASAGGFCRRLQQLQEEISAASAASALYHNTKDKRLHCNT